LKFEQAFIVVPISGELHNKNEQLFFYAIKVGLEQNLAGIWYQFMKPVYQKNRLKSKISVSGYL
jgi:hypothetical protein